MLYLVYKSNAFLGLKLELNKKLDLCFFFLQDSLSGASKLVRRTKYNRLVTRKPNFFLHIKQNNKTNYHTQKHGQLSRASGFVCVSVCIYYV